MKDRIQPHWLRLMHERGVGADPISCRTRGWERRTEVHFTVRPDGSVGELVVMRSSGSPSADAAAVDAVLVASPFRPPPAELLGADGAVSTHQTFVVSPDCHG